MKCSRRHWLTGIAGGLSAAPLAMNAQVSSEAEISSKAEDSKLAMPGLYRGRVIAVEHPNSIVSWKVQAEPIRQMIHKGMMDLTGAPDVQSAWRQFFQKGDVVGIKVNPVGMPHVISCSEVLREIISGLNSAGLKNEDIVVYDRYRAQFYKAGFNKWLPQGVRSSSATNDYDNVQQAIEGYDPDHYMDMALTLPGQDINNPTARHSYAANFITKEVNKLINLPVLKDHQSAGITLALKNLSHGLVNNVNRSHSSKTLNACGSFIPAVVAMP
ncbi:MAG: DUF362 domain-containing protein, partial [Bryobacteraceae bacterium]